MKDSVQVVITSCGVVTPLGLDAEQFRQNLVAGNSVVQKFERVNSIDDRWWYHSRVEEFEAKKYVRPKKSIKLICREIQFAFGAAMMACEQAGIEPGTIDPDRFAVCFGGEMLYSEFPDLVPQIQDMFDGEAMHYERWAKNFMSTVYPLWMLKSLPNMAACHIGIAMDARGPCNTITTEETASLMAIHEAYLTLQRGVADAVIVGAAGGMMSPTRHLQFPREHFAEADVDGPSAAKPFDKNRIGMARSEGAACIILETAASAAARGVKPIGELLSVASGVVAPKVYRSGSARAVAQVLDAAMHRAGVSAGDLDHVNTGAGGSITLDAAQAIGVAQAAPGVPVVAIQGGVGNINAGMGMCELVGSLVTAAADQTSPWTTNYKTKDPALDVEVLAEPYRKLQRPTIAKISQTPYGQTAAIIVKLLDL